MCVCECVGELGEWARGAGGDLTLTSRQVKRGTSPYVDVCGSANDPGPEMIPILDCKRSRSEN